MVTFLSLSRFRIVSLEPFTTLLALRHHRVLRDTERSQRALLARVLATSRASPVAKALGISGDESYGEFLDVPARAYSFYAPFVEQILDGDHHAFGRDPVVALGETSGSVGAPKLVPHTAASLHSIRRFAERLLLYQLLDGEGYLPRLTKWLAVTASTKLREERGIPIGFISGLMHRIAHKKRGGFMLPSTRVAEIQDWDERIQRSLDEAWNQRVGTLLGVPAYLMRFLEAAHTRAKAKPLAEVWPLLGRAYFSGTSNISYQAEMERVIGRPLLTQGLYTATEGSFAAELDRATPGELSLMVDMAVFTFRDVDQHSERLLAAWELTSGRRYEIVVTTQAGLIQYEIGDVVEITSTCPVRLRVVGRTADEINLATEKLSTRQVLLAMQQVASRVGVHRDHFIVTADPQNAKRHLWLVEANGVSETQLSVLVDDALKAINPSYSALRKGDAMLHVPRVIIAARGDFDDYVRAGFTSRGQFKFRHIFPDARVVVRTAGLERFAKHLGVV